MHYIGVRQPDIAGVGPLRRDMREASGQRPDLALPTVGERAGTDDGDIGVSAGVAGDPGRSVAALVVDHDDGEPAGVVLFRERAHGLADRFCLVPRRDYRSDPGPGFGRRCRARGSVETRLGAPETSAHAEKADPGGQRDRRQDSPDHQAVLARSWSICSRVRNGTMGCTPSARIRSMSRLASASVSSAPSPADAA